MSEMDASELLIPDSSIDKLITSLDENVPRFQGKPMPEFDMKAGQASATPMRSTPQPVQTSPFEPERNPSAIQNPKKDKNRVPRWPFIILLFVAISLVPFIIYSGQPADDTGISQPDYTPAESSAESHPAEKTKGSFSPEDTATSTQDAAHFLSSPYLLNTNSANLFTDILGCDCSVADGRIALLTDIGSDEIMNRLKDYCLQTLHAFEGPEYHHFESGSASDDLTSFIVIINAVNMDAHEKEAVSNLIACGVAFSELSGAGEDVVVEVSFNNMLGNTVRRMNNLE